MEGLEGGYRWGEGEAGAKGEGEVGLLEMMTPLLPLPAYQEQQISFFIGGGHKVGRPIQDELWENIRGMLTVARPTPPHPPTPYTTRPDGEML